MNAVLLTIGFLLSVIITPVMAQVFRCVDGGGKVAYQQRACDGAGTEVDARPANEQVRPTNTPSVSLPAKPREAKAEEPKEPRNDRLAAHRPGGLRLSRGMGLRQVVEAWGLPTEIRNDRNYTFMHWCDMRMALLVDGQLEGWDAPFADSRKGVQLFTYGEPWIRASQRWGVDRKTSPYSGPMLGRGDVQKWTELRWIVTDTHGNIVGWCDAAEHRSPTPPPAFNPPWDNALSR